MKIAKRQNGLTLIEIIISLAIISIIAAVFLTVFGDGSIAISRMGQKTKAMAQAQEIIDRKAYSSLRYYGSDYSGMINDPFDPAQDNVGRYCIIADSLTMPALDSTLTNKSYNEVKVLIYYGSKKNYVTLSSITKDDP